MMGGLVGVLLAAGKSERFDDHKGMAQLPDGTPMALRSAMNLRAVLVDMVCVVRPDDEALYSLFDEEGFNVAVAEDAALGMSASLQVGVNALPDAAGWMIALADMPLIQPGTYSRLVNTFIAKQRIIVPCLKGRLPLALCREGGPGGEGGQIITGHPVTFPSRYKSDLLSLNGDKGAKSILRQHADDIQQVWVDDPGILQDFDTQEAFKRLFI